MVSLHKRIPEEAASHVPYRIFRTHFFNAANLREPRTRKRVGLSTDTEECNGNPSLSSRGLDPFRGSGASGDRFWGFGRDTQMAENHAGEGSWPLLGNVFWDTNPRRHKEESIHVQTNTHEASRNYKRIQNSAESKQILIESQIHEENNTTLKIRLDSFGYLLLLDLFGYVWIRLAMFRYVWPRLVTKTYFFWIRLDFGRVWIRLDTFGYEEKYFFAIGFFIWIRLASFGYSDTLNNLQPSSSILILNPHP